MTCKELKEENKELVAKCNQLEKQLERTKETLFEEEDRIKSLLENKHELSSKVLQLEKELETKKETLKVTVDLLHFYASILAGRNV